MGGQNCGQVWIVLQTVDFAAPIAKSRSLPRLRRAEKIHAVGRRGLTGRASYRLTTSLNSPAGNPTANNRRKSHDGRFFETSSSCSTIQSDSWVSGTHTPVGEAFPPVAR